MTTPVDDSPELKLIDGVLVHVWPALSGQPSVSWPVLVGAESDDDGGADDDDDGDEDDDDANDDDDEGGDDDDDDDKAKNKKVPSKASQNRAHRDAAKYRTRLRDERTAHAATKTELETVKAENATLKGDSTKVEAAVKEENAQLKTKVTELEAKVAKFESEAREASLSSQVSEEIEDLEIDGDPDWVIIKLKKNGMLNVDDDGEIEDLVPNLKRLLKRGVLKKVTSGDDDGADGADGKTPANRNGGAGRSGRPVNGNSKRKTGVDKAKLAKKFPALAGRV